MRLLNLAAICPGMGVEVSTASSEQEVGWLKVIRHSDREVEEWWSVDFRRVDICVFGSQLMKFFALA
jgi:hypothetical protein